ncbi:MAG: hypothetical protein JW981_00275 [Anaerolineae bacterium]|nr:hypothetical protein [Anaerolineae bacterium]
MSISKELKVVPVVLAALLLLFFTTGVSASDLELPVFQSPLGGNSTIRGAAFLDSNRNGVMDAGEPGVGKVYFTISMGDFSHTYYSEDRTVDSAGNTYATGYYGPVPLAEGTWKVTLHVPAGYVATVPIEQYVYVPAYGYTEVNLGVYGSGATGQTTGALLPTTGLGTQNNILIIGTLGILIAGLLVSVVLGLFNRQRG